MKFSATRFAFMRFCCLAGLLLVVMVGAAVADDRARYDARIRQLTAKFEAMQADPAKAVPAEHLKQARGIILLDRTKAGFIFAFEGGGGVALVKEGLTENYGPAAFVRGHEASLGVQIGGEQNFYVILLMTTNAARGLIDAKINFAGEARGTAGEKSVGESGKLTAPDRSMLVYSDRAGLYGGAAVKGGAVSAYDEANRKYYGEYFTVHDILFNQKVKPTDAAKELAKKLTEAAKPARKQ
jgi:lipid-binding SYLF domain-containing protein